MQIKVISKKAVLDDVLGRLHQGEVYDLPEHKAQFFVERGDAELVNGYETKVLNDEPETPRRKPRKTKDSDTLQETEQE